MNEIQAFNQLKNVVDAICDSIEGTTDDEILEDARAAGIDVRANAARYRQLLLSALLTEEET